MVEVLQGLASVPSKEFIALQELLYEILSCILYLTVVLENV